jgi:hypothetical protein
MKDGDAGFTKFLDTGPTFLISSALTGNVFNTANFSTYMTALKSCGTGCQNANMWIDEFIISTQPIAAPGLSSSTTLTPPAAPTGLVLQ